MSFSDWLWHRFRPLSLGERGEKYAARYLRKLGYKILYTRYRLQYGEIDILAVEGQTVVFVEVKTRRSQTKGSPAEAVDSNRQARLTRAALAFLKANSLLEYASRFDVIEVVWPEDQKRPTLRHLQNAFPSVGRRQFFS